MKPVPYSKAEESIWDIKLKNNETGEIYEGKYTDLRLQIDTVPSGNFAYNCRHSDDGCWLDPATIESGNVDVNFAGVFISKKRLVFPEGKDYICVTEVE